MAEQTPKQAYVSPPDGVLEITIIRDAQPRVSINLDLGIPNFTVFSMNIPLVEDQPKAMSGLIAELLHVLLDEVASFMMSMEYEDEIIIQMYATVLATFKSMSTGAAEEADTVKTFEGKFTLPIAFVNETQKRVVTAASSRYEELARFKSKFDKFYYDKQRSRLEQAYNANRNKETGGALSNYDFPKAKAMLDALTPYVENEPLFEEQRDLNHEIVSDQYIWAKKNVEAAQEALGKGLPDVAPMFVSIVLGNVSAMIDQLMRLEKPEARLAATKIERMPKVRHIELTYSPKPKPTVNDAARVIRQYRNRSLKQQPKPLYVIVYDQMGRPTGTLALGPKFKNQLLSLTNKKGSVDFLPPVSFPNEQAMHAGVISGVPKAISVGGMTYRVEGVAGADMALYHGPQDWLAKFPDGRSQIFPGRPTFRTMRRLNFPVPRNRFNWTILPPEEPQKPAEQSIGEETAEEGHQK